MEKKKEKQYRIIYPNNQNNANLMRHVKSGQCISLYVNTFTIIAKGYSTWHEPSEAVFGTSAAMKVCIVFCQMTYFPL